MTCIRHDVELEGSGPDTKSPTVAKARAPFEVSDRKHCTAVGIPTSFDTTMRSLDEARYVRLITIRISLVLTS